MSGVARTLDLVLFRSGEWTGGIEASQVIEMQSASATLQPQPSSVPHPLEILLGLPTVIHRAPRMLSLRDGSDTIVSVADSPIELVTVEVAQIYPLPSMLKAARITPSLRALAMIGHIIVPLFVLLPDSLRKSLIKSSKYNLKSY